MRKFVISGGPASGKTTLINELKQRKYPVVEEVAFKLMHEKPRITSWKKFNYDVFERQLIEESKILESSDVVFLDRCLIDELAYMKFYQIEFPMDYKEKVKAADYKKFFFLDVLPDRYYYVTFTGEPRKLDIWAARELHSLTKKMYAEFNIPLIPVPFLNVNGRADFVLKNL